jgi:hypothetical protein
VTLIQEQNAMVLPGRGNLPALSPTRTGHQFLSQRVISPNAQLHSSMFITLWFLFGWFYFFTSKWNCWADRN